MRRFFSRELQFLNPILKFWRLIAPYLKSAVPALLLLLFIAVHLFVWWKGPSFVIAEEKPLSTITSRVLFSIAFTLLVSIVVGFLQRKEVRQYYRDRQKEELLNTDIKAKYLRKQKEELDDLMVHFKENYQRENHLYDLPWYLVLGYGESGKTSLLQASGQEFLFTSMLDASNFKSENPYSYNWWFTDEALFIDPDSELLSQRALKKLAETDSDPQLARHLWLHFLEWLGDTRPQRPLNGIVMVVDLPDLINTTVINRRAQAGTLRARIQEVIAMISSQLPVYIVFSKMDQLQGFKEFFKHLKKEDREKLLGFTFSIEASKDSKQWLVDFEIQYQLFMTRIKASLPKAMIDNFNENERASLYSFYQQLAGIEQILHQFLKEVLISDKYTMQPLIRGVYFTSVYQQGAPSNIFIKEIVKRYNLDHFAIRAQDNRYSKPHFIKDLFHSVILKESGLATDNHLEQARKQRILKRSLMTGVSIAAIFLLFVNYFYFSNKSSLAKVTKKVEEYSQIANASDAIDPTGKVMLPELNILRDATLELGDYHTQTFYSDLGLNQSKKVGKAVEETYLRLLNYRYLRHLMAGIAQALTLAEPESDEQLKLLRVFHMLTQKKARQPGIVKNYFADYWQRFYAGDATTQISLMNHLDYSLQHTDLGGERARNVQEAENVLVPYDSLIKSTQADLRKIPMEQRIYRSFKYYGLARYETPLDLRTEIGPAFDIIFDTNLDNRTTEIPMIFTKKGLDQYYTVQTDRVYELALVDDWIIGQRDDVSYTNEDLEWFKTKIREYYGADYVANWRQALNALHVKKFENISDGVLVLDSVLGGSQPFQRLLSTINENTHLFANLPEDNEARAELEKSHSYALASKVNRDFSKLNMLTKSVASTEEDGIAPIFNTEVMDHIQNVHSQLKAIQDAPNSGQLALITAKNRINLNDSDPIYALSRVASKLPAPMNNIVSRLATESWNVILEAALAEVDKKWNEKVYYEFSTVLADKYPFNKDAKIDVSLDEFIHFFGKEGTITQFYQNDLAPFLNEQLMVDNGNEPLIKDSVRNQLEMAEQIRQAFFNQQGVLGIEFMIAPVSMGHQVQRSVLNIEGQYVVYTHGPKHGYSLVWPNTISTPSHETVVRLTMTGGRQSQRTLTYQGPWAIFRMLDNGQITSLDSHTLSITYNLSGIPMRYELTAFGDINPFTVSLLRNFYLSPSLYK